MTRSRFTAAFVAKFLARLRWTPAPKHARKWGPCRVWTGATTADGYGNLVHEGVNYLAHAVAFELANGRPARGEVIRHRCGVRSCCSGAHLVEGSQRQNVADSIADGTFSPPPHPHCDAHPNAKLNTADVRDAMERLERGEATQQEIADELGVSQARVSQVFNGKGWRCR